MVWGFKKDIWAWGYKKDIWISHFIPDVVNQMSTHTSVVSKNFEIKELNINNYKKSSTRPPIAK